MGHSRWRAGAIVAIAVATLFSLSGVGSASGNGNGGGAAGREQARNSTIRAQGGQPSATHTPDDGDLADQAAQYDSERTAPSGGLSGAALVDAVQQANSLPATPGAWQEVTTSPYNAEPANYLDPTWSNSEPAPGAGFSIVGGRVTALTTTKKAWFAGTADGGVWTSTDHGATWAPTFDNMPSLSIGALAVDPADGSLWVGTGEANTNGDSYDGTGVYRSTTNGTSYARVGDDSAGNNPLVSHTVFQIAFDPSGNAYAGTDDGLYRFDAASGTWTEVLDPAGPNANPPYPNQVTSVAVVPGSDGQDVIAANAWRSADLPTNGFYESTDGGQTFQPVTLGGDIDSTDIGRTTFAYSADGTKLYAIVESPKMLGAADESVLQGIFVSSGSPARVAGPWTKIADEKKLGSSGSALATGSGFGVGVQAWYNEDLAVDPADPNHLYAGLEEVFQSTDGGTTWTTASPYWNFGLACFTSTTNPCPNVTHPDQHAMMITNGQLVIGNDGGVYGRSLSDADQYGGWTDMNATLHDLQYYDARAGRLGSSGVGVWGGLQDNGTAVLAPGAQQLAEAAGGDGFDVIVDPSNADNMVGEYTEGTMYSSTDGGHSFADFVSPTCFAQADMGLTPRKNCDPAARFVTPLVQDAQTPTTWVTGGQFVWTTRVGWNTRCDPSCDWRNVFDTGAGNAVTALSSVNSGNVIWAAWVGGGGNPGRSFSSGIATNASGKWRQVNVSSLPNRYIAGITADPNHPLHAYAIFNGYSRRWIPGGGVGHVFETTNGGNSWTDISGNLPDIASDALVMAHGQLALATDAGVFTAAAGGGSGTQWSRLGSGLPNASVNNLTVGPDGDLYAATHGRGVWRMPF